MDLSRGKVSNAVTKDGLSIRILKMLGSVQAIKQREGALPAGLMIHKGQASTAWI